ncbi:MAG: glycosyltransferase family 4 protein, partial [Pirellulales bacterium]
RDAEESLHLRGMQIERGGAPAERCHVVRNGPDARFLQPVEPHPSLRDGGRPVIGYVGMMGVQDGVDYLLRALACLKNDFGRVDFRADIVGSGPALPHLQRLTDELGLGEIVRFCGYRIGDDLLKHLAGFDICVTPDPSNPYNDSCTTVKSMEYMAMGKPVVAFDLPENRITLADAALYATGNNVRELAQLIARLIDNPIERKRLGQRGRQRVIDYFYWERQQDMLIQLYDGLLRRPQRSRSIGHRKRGTLPNTATMQTTAAAFGNGRLDS